jgi:D-tagatose-1,6-bisphosphate aldolase subunit GatZ/KbaZ
MANADFIGDIVKNKYHKNSPGVFSICSANPYVLRASIRAAKKSDLSLLIESTCNQVNQYGGYMNLKPEEYVNYIDAIAEEMEFPLDRIFLGGDHLGPSVWKNEPAESAMKKSVEMIRAYVRAGFQKSIWMPACLARMIPIRS